MKYDLTIDFAGLCTFVTNDAPEWLRVILLRDAKERFPHAPRLTFDVRNLDQFTGSDISQVVQLPGGEQIASWNLEGKIVELGGLVDGDGSPSRVACCGPAPAPREKPADPLDELNFYWVPSLGQLCGVRDVAPAHIGNNPGGDGSPVGARFDTKRGYLFSNAEVNRTTTDGGVWEFGQGGHRQYLADTVRLEVRNLAASRVEIKARTFAGADAGALRLKPFAERIGLTLTNLPQQLPDTQQAHDVMHHFDLYYDVLVTQPIARPIPQLGGGAPSPHHATTAAQPVWGIFPVRCTPSQTP